MKSKGPATSAKRKPRATKLFGVSAAKHKDFYAVMLLQRKLVIRIDGMERDLPMETENYAGVIMVCKSREYAEKHYPGAQILPMGPAGPG